MMLRARPLFCLLLTALLLQSPGRTLAAETTPALDLWLGMYLGKLKIGYTNIRQNREEFRGAPAIRTESSSRTELTVLGQTMVQQIRTVVYSDLTTRPVYEEFEMSSGGKTTRVIADIGRDSIQCRLVTASGESRRTIPIPPGTELAGDAYMTALDSGLKVGDVFQRKSFNPLTLALDDITVRVDRKETIEFEGKPVETLVILTKTPMAELTTYQSLEDGQALRIDAAMGITMLREPRDKAMGIQPAEYRPPQDFAILTSVRSNVDLPSTGKLRRLHIRLIGLPDDVFVLEDSRQRLLERGETDGAKTATLLIRAEAFDPGRSAELPVEDESLLRWMSAAPYVDSDAIAIRRKARDIVRDEKNIFRAALAIRDWVHRAMAPRGEMGILRPATDVLKDLAGVCRDYSVLFAALARASGIPCRIVGGLVLNRGDFYYHAWNEVWTGEQWVPLDCTTPDAFVDATHIKLTEGEATEMFRMGRIIGQLKAEVLAFE